MDELAALLSLTKLVHEIEQKYGYEQGSLLESYINDHNIKMIQIFGEMRVEDE